MNPIGLAKQTLQPNMGAIIVINILSSALKLKCVIETNLIRVSYHCINCTLIVTVVKTDVLT